MKKVFVVGSLNNAKMKDSVLKESQAICYRDGDKLYYQNIEFYPKERASISFSPSKNTVSLTFKLNNGEFIAIGNEQGMAKKAIIEKKSSKKKD